MNWLDKIEWTEKVYKEELKEKRNLPENEFIELFIEAVKRDKIPITVLEGLDLIRMMFNDFFT